ncbi:hypothetical protein EQ850_04935 [Enterococcus hirae]|nr:hypothetical protein EQ850_04935 [Enterococcus hirae]
MLFVNNFFKVFFDRIKLRKLLFFNDSVILSCDLSHVKNFLKLFFIFVRSYLVITFEQIIIYQLNL